MHHLATNPPDKEHNLEWMKRKSGSVRNEIPLLQPMSRKLESVILDKLFIVGEHSIKYEYIVVPSKQCETGSDTLLLVRTVNGEFSLYALSVQCK